VIKVKAVRPEVRPTLTSVFVVVRPLGRGSATVRAVVARGGTAEGGQPTVHAVVPRVVADPHRVRCTREGTPGSGLDRQRVAVVPPPGVMRGAQSARMRDGIAVVYRADDVAPLPCPDGRVHGSAVTQSGGVRAAQPATVSGPPATFNCARTLVHVDPYLVGHSPGWLPPPRGSYMPILPVSPPRAPRPRRRRHRESRSR
jgi:hypothetical protein